MGRIFIGIEAEGRFAGLRTLFIDGDSLPTTQRLGELLVIHQVAHVYLGASSIPVNNWPQAIEYLDRYQHVQFTIELPYDTAQFVSAELYGKAHFILKIPVNSIAMLGHDVEVKLQAQDALAVYRNPQIVSLVYLRDKDVEK